MKKQLLKTLLLSVLFVASNAFSQTIQDDDFASTLGDWVPSNTNSTIAHNAAAGATALGAMEITIDNAWRGAKDVTIDMSAGAAGTFNLSYKIRYVSGAGATACKAYVKQDGVNVTSTQQVISGLPQVTGADGATWYEYSDAFTVADASVNLEIEIIIGGPNTTGADNVILIDDVLITGPTGATLSAKNFETVEFNLYPNPVKNTLNIESKDSISNIAVYDLLGKQVISSNTINNSMDVSSLSNGVYIIKLTSDKGIGTKRFVKE